MSSHSNEPSSIEFNNSINIYKNKSNSSQLAHSCTLAHRPTLNGRKMNQQHVTTTSGSKTDYFVNISMHISNLNDIKYDEVTDKSLVNLSDVEIPYHTKIFLFLGPMFCYPHIQKVYWEYKLVRSVFKRWIASGDETFSRDEIRKLPDLTKCIFDNKNGPNWFVLAIKKMLSIK